MTHTNVWRPGVYIDFDDDANGGLGMWTVNDVAGNAISQCFSEDAAFVVAHAVERYCVDTTSTGGAPRG